MMNTSTFKTGTHHLYVVTALLWVVLTISCNDRNVVDPQESAESRLSLQMRAANAETFAANTSLYMFNASDRFWEKKLNVTQEGNKLSTDVAIGTWNIVLLTCDKEEYIRQNITLPSPLSPMGSAIMWQTPVTTDGLFLSQTPSELRYGLLRDVVIKQDEVTEKSTLLYRNVAKVQVILKHYEGFDPVTDDNKAMAYAELLDVPTSLAWTGKLYPNGDSPAVSDKPIRENFEFDGAGKADTLNFIVPAHRGDDAFITNEEGILVQNPAAVDTTEHKLKLRVSMPSGGKEYFGKSANGIEIPIVPKINSIMQVNVTFHGKTSLDIKIGVKPWEDWIIQEEEFQ
ncbi:Mfa2 [Proteiniphilum saccharofermentans]|uniref:Mfa2 n=1 Tax=Proteiniphilum saccharofermentans TaxID=1642647 RepID=A0A1R3SY01_9BACT|nr:MULTISPECIES: FimB/Mfa2 family fimbrial subunit [Proteiniphilum]SCD19800.1 Mfa2 [Proteiniphilum saccharofermentans]SFK92380.1 Fimbrillin-A associated anchor protein Mfa1 and Mfa2 [Porphyromonadaceae bacterium KH3CP3RA]